MTEKELKNEILLFNGLLYIFGESAVEVYPPDIGKDHLFYRDDIENKDD